jgi:hypothetical protein
MNLIQLQYEQPGLSAKLKANGFFLTTPEDLARIVLFDRLAPVLVRCGGGRFTAPAQDVNHFLEMVRKSDDYVRDISLIVK